MDDFRILHFGYTSNLGGVEVFIRNAIIYSDIPMDIVVTAKGKVPFEDEIKAHGGRVLRIPSRRSNPFKYEKNIINLLKEHPEYKIVHVHINTASSIEPLAAAKKTGRIAIAHSHSSNAAFGARSVILHKINRHRLKHITDLRLACAQKAGEFMYDADFKIINNGIETDKFIYNVDYRKKIRAEFNIPDKSFVILHVGVFSQIKNQKFLINCFKKVVEKDKNSVLILIGEGSGKEDAYAEAEELGIRQNIIFAGKRQDVNEFYSAADLFVLPSLFEGLSFTAVEAQTSGLHCILSSGMSDAVDITELAEHIPLESGADVWAEKMLDYNNSYERKNMKQDIINCGFDISSSAQSLKKLYLDLLK